jgi:hypothetical protein
MTGDDLTTPQGEQEAPGKPKTENYGFGPRTEAAVNEQLEMVMAFAFLGKRAFTDAGRDWDQYLSKIGCPIDEEGLIERAFEGLLQVACTAWNEMFEPRDSVKGQLIDRTKKEAPAGGE